MILLQCKLNGSFLFSGLSNGFIKGKVFQIAFKTACTFSSLIMSSLPGVIFYFLLLFSIGQSPSSHWLFFTHAKTLATCCKEMTHWKIPWCWGRLRARGEGGDRGWDGWIASLTQWSWIWANSRRQWRTGKAGVLQSMGSQRVRHDLQTELQEHNPEILLPQDLYTHCSLCLWGCSSSYLPADSFTSVSPFIRRHLLNENLSCHSKWTSSPPHTSISISEFSAIPLCFFFFSLSFL